MLKKLLRSLFTGLALTAAVATAPVHAQEADAQTTVKTAVDDVLTRLHPGDRPLNASAEPRRTSIGVVAVDLQGSTGAMSTETFIFEVFDSVKITPFTGGTSP